MILADGGGGQQSSISSIDLHKAWHSGMTPLHHVAQNLHKTPRHTVAFGHFSVRHVWGECFSAQKYKPYLKIAGGSSEAQGLGRKFHYHAGSCADGAKRRCLDIISNCGLSVLCSPSRTVQHERVKMKLSDRHVR